MRSQRLILIIEDNRDVAQYCAMLIGMSGLGEARVYENGMDGLLALFREVPDCLVLDLDLPGMRGEDVLRFVRASKDFGHLPVVIVSALPEAQRRELELLRMGADAYLEKPLREKSFVQTLERLMNRQETVRSLASPDSTAGTSSRDFIAAALGRELNSPLPAKPPPTPMAARAAFEPHEDEKVVRNAAANEGTPPERSASPESTVPARTGGDSNGTREAFEGYQLLKIVGAGGMGTVYKARQIKLQRIVALKVLLENLHFEPLVRERFHREALIMAQVNHPNIVQVYETGATEHTSYFSMEFVDGPSLADRIRKGDLEWIECVEIIRQTCNAIAYLHGEHILHRDIKPQNILISRQGLVKVTDFGISRARLTSDAREFTRVVQFMGTPEYMAPELDSLSAASEASDQFSLGMTFWRMFAGAEARKPGAPLHSLHAEIPKDLSRAIARCIKPDPAKRFSNVQAARDAIVAACKESVGDDWRSDLSSPV